MSRARLGVGRVVVAVGLMAALLPLAPSAHASSVTPADDSWSKTKTVTREFVDGGTTQTVDSRDVTVRLNHTTGLQGRERIHVSWSGARPSAGRAASPYGEDGLLQEYPVVILQCRGVDDPTAPTAQQISPSTCWTNTRQQRSQVLVDPSRAVWAHDLYASDADRAQKSGLDPFPSAECDLDPDDTYNFSHVTPFVASDGKVYKSCTAETMAPEAAVGTAFPAAEQEAFTRTDGTGDADFEVRSSVENESLGCSATVACSLVVIPIMGLSCMDEDYWCRLTGQFAPGSDNFTNRGVDAAVSPYYWWSASNWRNRISAPLTFGLPPGVCDLLDPRDPTEFFGSELLSQVALQWAPAYCLSQSRFKWEANTMSDDAAFALMQGGGAVAAEVSGKRQTAAGAAPVGYAPTAVTGFAVSYVVDKPDNQGEVTDLKLNARLLAKLLTESYPASARGRTHPGLENNPLSLNTDPEFKRLNPGLSDIESEAAATVMSLSISSDVIKTLTSYIAADPAAAAFVAGTPDPDGMKVNPYYKGLSLPVSSWPLLDKYTPPSNLECYQQNPTPYLPQVAAPVNNLRAIAAAVIDSWPLVATKCDRPTPTDPWKLGRVDRQGMGSRFLLGITTLGDSARYGLQTAALQASPGHYVRPDDGGLSAAISLAKPGKSLEPFTITQAAVRGSATAYPGTMVVYTAARLRGMASADAAKVAQFIRVSSTEGQVRGRGNGQLPEGYLPILDTGPTKPLYAAAQSAAKAIAAQKAAPTTDPPPDDTSAAANEAAKALASLANGGAGAGATPKAAAAAKSSTDLAPVSSTTKTGFLAAGLGGWLLPLLAGLGLTALIAAGLSKEVLRRQGTKTP